MRRRRTAGGLTGVGALVAALIIIAVYLSVDRSQPSTVVDIAPTILWRLGLPLSRELPGTAITGLFPASVKPTEDRYVPTYGRPFMHTPPSTGKALDQEMIDRLRSLGYIK